MIDFDNIDDWAAKLGAAVAPWIPASARSRIRKATLEYVDDTLDKLFDLTDRDALIDATLNWIRSSTIVAYHGSRLTDEDVALIEADGLKPLRAADPVVRLTRALSKHPKWCEVAGRFDPTHPSYGTGEYIGNREGQVHLTLSRSALLDGFNQYLTHGSEFDRNIACLLLGSEGMELLERDGSPAVIQVAVPGRLALQPDHILKSIRANGNTPDMARHFLEAWSYRLAKPRFQSRKMMVDCGIVFNKVVPADWILKVQVLRSVPKARA